MTPLFRSRKQENLWTAGQPSQDINLCCIMVWQRANIDEAFSQGILEINLKRKADQLIELTKALHAGLPKAEHWPKNDRMQSQWTSAKGLYYRAETRLDSSLFPLSI